ncbi:type II secretion system minor pseudopilin GspH [Legionella dresdenensis]|uniref:Type II secretion system protein H n=1 Tax=Legionella dresdenensis TaxID=450200 RepID=A0ABV8CBE8_9GAMM
MYLLWVRTVRQAVTALMLKSVIGMRVSRCHQQGFTLIEILVVLLIIGIVSSAALLAFGDFGARRKAIVSAEQFAAYIKLVQQKAILEMNTLGIKIESQGYQAFRFEDGSNWKAINSNNLFRWHAFPRNIIVKLSNAAKSKNHPDIIINPSGDMSDFALDFGTDSEAGIAILYGRQDGRLTLQTGVK